MIQCNVLYIKGYLMIYMVFNNFTIKKIERYIQWAEALCKTMVLRD